MRRGSGRKGYAGGSLAYQARASSVRAGRGERIALRWNEESISYAQLSANVNRAGNAFLRLGIRPEERVILAMWDSPDFVYSFWGAVKIGAVPVPVNTFLRADEYAYVLENSGASALIASAELWPTVASVASRRLRQRLVAGDGKSDAPALARLMADESPGLEAAPTHRDDMALWL